MAAAIARWRTHALAIVAGRIDSTESQRRLAWRFLVQHRGKNQ